MCRYVYTYIYIYVCTVHQRKKCVSQPASFNPRRRSNLEADLAWPEGRPCREGDCQSDHVADDAWPRKPSIYTCVHMCIDIYMYVNMYIYIYTCMYVHMYVCTCVCRHPPIYVYICTCWVSESLSTNCGPTLSPAASRWCQKEVVDEVLWS